jgi:hypothetical protein
MTRRHVFLSEQEIISWFPPKWFTPSTAEAKLFAVHLQPYELQNKVERAEARHGVSTESAWVRAVETLVQDLPDLIRMVIEDEANDPILRLIEFRTEDAVLEGILPPEALDAPKFSAVLATLLHAARQARISPSIALPRHTSEPWHDCAQVITEYVAGMAKRAGKTRVAISHAGAPAIKVTHAAMCACGYHMVTPDGIRKMLQRRKLKV